MKKKELKSGKEILDEYFSKLKDNPEIDVDLRNILYELWKQERLYTKTYINREIETLISKKAERL